MAGHHHRPPPPPPPPPPAPPLLTTSPFHLPPQLYANVQGHPVAAAPYHEPDFASLVYRVPQVSDQQQQQHHADAAFLAASGPGFAPPAIRYPQSHPPPLQQPPLPPPPPQHPQLSIHTRHQARLARAAAVASSMAAEEQSAIGGMTAEEYAEYQKLSNEYEPEVKVSCSSTRRRKLQSHGIGASGPTR